MKKISFAITLLLILGTLLCSCSDGEVHDENALTDWDLLITGCYEQWDKNLKNNDNYKIGIIDFHTPVLSDSQQTEQFHDELILKLVKKISPNCETQMVILSNDADSDDINTAIESLYENGCHIINMSFGQSEPILFSSYVLDKIKNETLVLVCAAGNQNKGILYPAADENAVCVYAKDINGGIAKTGIDDEVKKSFSAPGYHIYIDGDYYSGSSFATVYTSIAFAELFVRKQAHTSDLIEMAKKNAKNSISANDYGIVRIASK